MLEFKYNGKLKNRLKPCQFCLSLLCEHDKLAWVKVLFCSIHWHGILTVLYYEFLLTELMSGFILLSTTCRKSLWPVSKVLLEKLKYSWVKLSVCLLKAYVSMSVFMMFNQIWLHLKPSDSMCRDWCSSWFDDIVLYQSVLHWAQKCNAKR